MSKGDTFENDLLKLIFNATAIANIADNAAASPLTALYVSFHTGYPGEAGSQTTNEAAYGSYARTAVNRNSGGWTVTANSVSPAATISAPVASSGSETEFYFGIGTASSGTGKLLYWGILGSNLGPFNAKTTDTITIAGLSGLAVDDRIAFFAPPGAALPTGITEGTVYWVKTVSTDDITISTTQGGAALDITAVGDGYAFRMTGIAVTTGVQPQLSTSATIVED